MGQPRHECRRREIEGARRSGDESVARRDSRCVEPAIRLVKGLSKAKLAFWQDDPVAFVREMFEVVPDKWQEEVLAAFPKSPRLAMKACKGPGKTAGEAWL